MLVGPTTGTAWRRKCNSAAQMGQHARFSRFPHFSVSRAILISTGALVFLIAVAAAVLAVKWPFSRAAVIARLSKDTGANVSIASFETTYFSPGFRARQLVIADRVNGAAIVTAQNFRVRATWIGLLHEHLSNLDIDGFDLNVGKGHLSTKSESIGLARFDARNGSIQISSSNPQSQPFRLAVHQLIMLNLGASHPKFQLDCATLEPPGQFRASGVFGSKDTSVSAKYAYSGADLSGSPAVAGTLASSGRVSGTFKRLVWKGTADIPNFQVHGSAHSVHLESAYNVILNTSDVSADLQKVDASFGHTTISAQGRIASEQGQNGKTLRLTATVRRGRIEDLLTMFSSGARPGMTGFISFGANLLLPPSKGPLLRRAQLDGSFEMDDALFTNPKTQSPLDYLSESSHDARRAQERRDPDRIPATIEGSVRDADAVAHLEDVRYSMPGIDATLGGTFNLVSKAVRLNGVLTTTGELPDATSAFKAVILTVARPLFGIHKKGKDTIVGFTIGGTSTHPVLSLSSSKLLKDAEHAAAR